MNNNDASVRRSHFIDGWLDFNGALSNPGLIVFPLVSGLYGDVFMNYISIF